jgi:hypothetical protein
MVGSCGLNAPGPVKGPAAGCCEHGNEPSGSIKAGELIDYLSYCWGLIHGDSWLHGVE